MHPISCETPQNMILSPYKRYALMVKRSRRRPLTAESRVRFPMGVPKKSTRIASAFACKSDDNAKALSVIGCKTLAHK